MAFIDYFALLGVSESATAAEVRRAYRRRAFEVHPDRNPGDPQAAAAFKRLTQARDALLDPAARARHLAERAKRQASRARRPRASQRARGPHTSERGPEERPPPHRSGRRDDWTQGRPAKREGYNNARRDQPGDSAAQDPLDSLRFAATVLLAGLAWGLGKRL